jgi:hypothetical protein
MPGPHGFAVRKQYRSSTDTPRPSHPASYVRDDRDTPLCNGGGTARDLAFILIFRNNAGLRQIGTTGNVRLTAEWWRHGVRPANLIAQTNHIFAYPAQTDVLKRVGPHPSNAFAV